MICLDTNFLIRALVPGSRADLSLRSWLNSGEFVEINVIVWAEFLCGPLTPAQVTAAQALLPSPEHCSQQTLPVPQNCSIVRAGDEVV